MKKINLLSIFLRDWKVNSFNNNYEKEVGFSISKKRNSLKAFLIALATTFTFFSATSQTTDVELCVDLNCLPSVTAPSVFGAFNGWCANCNFVTDPDGDGIYCATVQMTPGDQEYKFFTQEEGDETLTPGLPCTVTNFGFTNRVITVGGTPLSEQYGWETCDPGPVFQDITLCVDLSCFTSVTAPSVFGQFNGWNAGANPVTDPDGDGVYCATVQMIDGDQEYKFFFQEEGEEGLTPGDPCTVTNFGFTNRLIVVAGQPLSETYGWEVCGPVCVPPPPGRIPNLTSGNPILVEGWLEAIRAWQASGNSVPSPNPVP